jgi:hypothetical protein
MEFAIVYDALTLGGLFAGCWCSQNMATAFCVADCIVNDFASAILAVVAVTILRRSVLEPVRLSLADRSVELMLSIREGALGCKFDGLRAPWLLAAFFDQVLILIQ